MKPNPFLSAIILTCLATVAIAAGAPTTRPGPRLDVHRLVVHPAALPSPVLKYTFVTPVADRTPGNAATLYLMAALVMPRDSAPLRPTGDGATRPATLPASSNESAENLAYDFRTMPVSELVSTRHGDVSAFLKAGDGTLRLIDLAADRQDCQWDFPPLDGKHPNAIGDQMSVLANMRYLSNVLAVRTRLEIAEHRYDDAIRSVQSGFALAASVRKQANIVQSEVAIGIAASMFQRLEELEQAPGSPNLYWALGDLPRPFINMRDALQYDALAVRGEFAAGGMYESIIPYTEYRHAWQQLYAAFLLPTKMQTLDALDRLANTPSNSIAATLAPSVRLIAAEALMPDRFVAMYQCVEAIRAYAEDHDGKLPASLDELGDDPAPPDPVTGKPFVYTLAGQNFTLDVPRSNWPLRHTIRLSVTMLPE